MNTDSKRKLSHIDEQGRAHMVDVGDKGISKRKAIARSIVEMQPSTMQLLLEGSVPKGDVLSVARVSAIQAAKKTFELIPLCHSIDLTSCQVTFETDPDTSRLTIVAEVNALDRTGAEMEALTAVSIGALTVYDMLKAVDRSMVIKEIVLLEKKGGKSGEFSRRMLDSD